MGFLFFTIWVWGSAWRSGRRSSAINLKKFTTGIPQLCIKLACNHISEALTLILNESLSQGIVPDSLKVFKVTPIDEGGSPADLISIQFSSYFYLVCFDESFWKTSIQAVYKLHWKHEPTLGNKCFPIKQLTSGMISLFTRKISVHFPLPKKQNNIYCLNNTLRNYVKTFLNIT